MKRIDDYNTTTDSRTYKMIRRRYTLRCDRCRPHFRENDTAKDNRTWKNHRRTQYKNGV